MDQPRVHKQPGHPQPWKPALRVLGFGKRPSCQTTNPHPAPPGHAPALQWAALPRAISTGHRAHTSTVTCRCGCTSLGGLPHPRSLREAKGATGRNRYLVLCNESPKGRRRWAGGRTFLSDIKSVSLNQTPAKLWTNPSFTNRRGIPTLGSPRSVFWTLGRDRLVRPPTHTPLHRDMPPRCSGPHFPEQSARATGRIPLP